MPRASNGVYTLPNTVNPVVTNTTVTSTWANTTLSDIESVLTSCLDRAGRGAMQANLQMGGYKVTGAADGTVAGDLVTKGQLDTKLAASAASAFGLDLIDSADAAAARTTLNTDIYKAVPVASAAATGEIFPVTAGFTLDTGLAAGSVFGYYNNSAAPITVTQGSGLTLRRNGTTGTGNATIPARGLVSVWAYSPTEYVISGAY